MRSSGLDGLRDILNSHFWNLRTFYSQNGNTEKRPKCRYYRNYAPIPASRFAKNTGHSRFHILKFYVRIIANFAVIFNTSSQFFHHFAPVSHTDLCRALEIRN